MNKDNTEIFVDIIKGIYNIHIIYIYLNICRKSGENIEENCKIFTWLIWKAVREMIQFCLGILS